MVNASGLGRCSAQGPSLSAPCGLGRGPVSRQGCPCLQGRALGLGGGGASLLGGSHSPWPLPWPYRPKSQAASMASCSWSRVAGRLRRPPKSCRASAHAAVLRRLHGAPEGRPWVWASGGGDSLIRHSHNRLSPSNGSLRPHVGRGHKSSGLMTRLGEPGHGSQLSGLGGGTLWMCGAGRADPLEIGAPRSRSRRWEAERGVWRRPCATRWALGP